MSLIVFTSFHLSYSFDLILLSFFPGDEMQGTLEIGEETKTSQELVEICGIHRTPPQNVFCPVTALMKFIRGMSFLAAGGMTRHRRKKARGRAPVRAVRPQGETVRHLGVRGSGLEGEGAKGKPCPVRSEAEHGSRRPLRRGVTHVSPRRGEKE